MTVDLGPDLKRAWTDWCAQRQLVPGKVLRTLVENALREGLQTPKGRATVLPPVTLGTHPDTAPKVGRELRFTESEQAAIEAVAQAQGFGFQDWVIAATRAALANAPAYGQVELEALTRSNQLLAQSVVELAALRRQESQEGVAQRLEQLELAVRAHVETVSTVMAQGAQRWQLKV
jgi:hypothetical protein